MGPSLATTFPGEMPPAAPIAPLAYAGDPGIGDQGPESVRPPLLDDKTCPCGSSKSSKGHQGKGCAGGDGARAAEPETAASRSRGH